MRILCKEVHQFYLWTEKTRNKILKSFTVQYLYQAFLTPMENISRLKNTFIKLRGTQALLNEQQLPPKKVLKAAGEKIKPENLSYDSVALQDSHHYLGFQVSRKNFKVNITFITQIQRLFITLISVWLRLFFFHKGLNMFLEETKKFVTQFLSNTAKTKK